MIIKVLGASGSELPGQNSPCFLLDNHTTLDAGTISNVLNEEDQYKINDIFLTHSHLDHIKAIPFISENIAISNTPHNINIYSIAPVLKLIKDNMLNNFIWPDFTVIPNIQNSIIKLIDLTIEKPIIIKDFSITPLLVNHAIPAVGYLIKTDDNKRIFYTGDTGPNDTIWDKIGQIPLDCLIIEVSFPDKLEELSIISGHLTPKLLNIELSKIKYPPKHIYITHIKQQYHALIKSELDDLMIDNLNILHDGYIIEV
ncbi:MAG: 3',5'-cyclic-nucleotide phosphodiesterase [Nitrospirae bacterium]|nr:3',5'-cyclic-nucleotide phosphodiesterase [Nitrospirota bacterium]